METISVCKICDSTLVGPVVGSFYYCEQCEMHYNIHLPSKEELKQTLKHMMLSACHSPEKMSRRLRNANAQLDYLSAYIQPGKLYDVGAAGGFLMKAARDRGWNVYGNEISQQAIQWAKTIYDLEIFYGFLEDSPSIENNDFDLVIFWNTLEHMRDPIADLGKAINMLKPGGLIHACVPIKTRENIVAFYEPGHIVEFSTKALDVLQCKYDMICLNRFSPKSRVPCLDLLWRKT